jgi:hypothetical protein
LRKSESKYYINILKSMNFRPNNYGNSYYDTNNQKLGYSNVSRGFGYSNRSKKYFKIDLIPNEDHNLGEV